MEENKFVNKGNNRRINVCHSCRYKTRNQNYKDRNNAIRNGYSFVEGEKQKLVSDQNGQCAICKESSKLVIDHDHSTGKVRGLLCHQCNIGIGMMKDSPDILRAASLYLIRE